MIQQIKNLKGITIVERNFKEGSINTSVSYGRFNVGRKTPGIAIKYVGTGTEEYTVEGKCRALFQGQFMLLRDDVRFDISHASNKQNTKGVCINLDVFGQNDYSDLMNNDLLFRIAFNGNLSTTLGAELKMISTDQIVSNDYDDNTLRQINQSLLSLSDELCKIQIRLRKDVKKTSTQVSIVQQLFLTREFIYSNYSSKISLDQLSRIAKISKYHFQRLFKTCFDISPIELIHQLRMNKAKKMMSTNKYSLSYIAQELGYSDLSSFSVQFKKLFCKPPSKYYSDLKISKISKT